MVTTTNSFPRLKFGIIVCTLLLGILTPSIFPRAGLSQTPAPNPLTSDPSDPLLPPIPETDQESETEPTYSLTPRERRKLAEELDLLNTQAQGEYATGNVDEAFATWYREIRLRRVLGKVDEVQTLGRVGNIAWQDTRKLDAQLITNRLETIEAESVALGELNLELLLALGQSYQQLRLPEQAANIYEQVLVLAQQAEDSEAQIAVLNQLGNLYLSWFNYPQAAQVYEQLLEIAREEFDQDSQTNYLQQLAFIYDQTEQTKEAVTVKEELIERYFQKQQLIVLPKLQISLADNYAFLGEPEPASQTYQQAFNLAWSLQQLNYAGEALEKLAQLYQEYNEPVYAVQIYQELLKLEQQSYNVYGQMTTYDQIGEIYFEQQDYSQALAAFRQGLDLANSLGYQQAYFQSKIDTVSEEF